MFRGTRDPLLANLVEHYTLRNTGGRRGNGLTNNSSVTFSGSEATFSGSNYLSHSGISPSATLPLTLVAEWQITNTAATQGIFGKGNAANYEYAFLYLNATGLAFYLGTGAGGVSFTLGDYSVGGSTGVPTVNSYVLTAARFDPAGGGSFGRVFIKGCKIGDGATSWGTENAQNCTAARGAPNAGGFTIGSRYGDGTTRLTGKVKNVGIWQSFLSDHLLNRILRRSINNQEWLV